MKIKRKLKIWCEIKVRLRFGSQKRGCDIFDAEFICLSYICCDHKKKKTTHTHIHTFFWFLSLYDYHNYIDSIIQFLDMKFLSSLLLWTGLSCKADLKHNHQLIYIQVIFYMFQILCIISDSILVWIDNRQMVSWPCFFSAGDQLITT